MVKPKLAHKGNILLCVPYVLLATAIKQISVKKKMAGGGGVYKTTKASIWHFVAAAWKS